MIVIGLRRRRMAVLVRDMSPGLVPFGSITGSPFPVFVELAGRGWKIPFGCGLMVWRRKKLAQPSGLLRNCF